ncbi:hypothetical protein Tco_1074208 [Tanacetum coccineum]
MPENAKRSPTTGAKDGSNELEMRFGTTSQRNDGRNAFNNRDGLVSYRVPAPYQAHRDQGAQRPRFNLSSLTKLPKEILATESQLNLQPPRPLPLPLKKENQDRYCDHHGEKGHYTNDCFQLKKQLEMALESGKLNHLIKDIRQRGRGNAKWRDAGKDKIIYMIRSWPDGKKRKSVERDESWMKVPIVFPPLSAEDVSDEPLVIEAVMEGYLVRRVYVDQGASLEGRRFVQDGNDKLHRSPSSLTLQRNLRKDRLESSLSSVLNDILHDKVSHSERHRNPGHTDYDHCRMLEAGKEVNDRKGSQSKNPPRRGGSEKSRLNRTDVNQPGIPGSTGYNRGKNYRKNRIKEVEEWVNAGIVRPIKYPTWIANPVLVKKADGSWRMCIDFKNLNSACPKDYYSLPNIDGKIESVVGFRTNVSWMRIRDTTKCRWLRTIKKRYAILHNRALCIHKEALRTSKCRSYLSKTGRYIGRNLEAYVDDMVIKSNDEKLLIAKIAETFNNLRKINMKLNLKKCSFGV